MTEWKCKLKDIDEYMSSDEVREEFLWDETLPIKPEVAEEAEEPEGIIVLWGPDIELKDYGLILSNGTYCVWDEDGESVPDFSLTMITDGGWAEYLYWEQDPPETALYNFLKLIGKGYNSDVECILKHKEAIQW